VRHSKLVTMMVAGSALLIPLVLVAPAGATTDPAKRVDRHWAATRPPATHRPDPGFGPTQRRSELARQQRLSAATADHLGLGPREALVVKDVLRDSDGTEHVRYDRTYAGLPVIGGDLVVEKASGGTPAVTGVTKASPARITVASTSSRLRGDAVRARAVAGSGLRAAAAPVKVVFAVHHQPVLAWQTTVTGTEKDGTPVRDLVYTDATTGRQLARLPQIRDANGRGRSLYSGTVTVRTVKAGSRYQLLDSTRGGHRTYDKQHKCCSTRGVLFTDKDNVWGTGTTSSPQSAAVDAAYGAATTWDFYKARFGRNGIRNDGRAAYSRVHFRKNYDNAFWDDSCFCMTYGDGNADFRPLVELDIAGHEMSHGVTAATAGLVYTGDAGGLDESTSDVMGAMVEFQAANRKDPGDYLIGEKVVRRGSYLRRMDNPHADHVSVNCWSPAVSSLDPHYSSGVGNHLFYLLAEGTGSKTIGGRAHSSTTCNGTTLTGIGRNAAAAIWYRALTTQWVSTTSYPQAADGMVAAARDLYGAGSTQCAATEAAWRGVAVPLTEGCAAPAPPANDAVANPDFESGDSGAWTVSSDVVGGENVITDSTNGLPHSGSWYAALNGYDGPTNESVSQTVTVPSAATDLLTFQLLIGTDDTGSSPHDTFTVEATADGTTKRLASWSNRNGDGVYAARTIDLSSYAGKSVLLRFAGHENNDKLATIFFLDDVGITTG